MRHRLSLFVAASLAAAFCGQSPYIAASETPPCKQVTEAQIDRFVGFGLGLLDGNAKLEIQKAASCFADHEVCIMGDHEEFYGAGKPSKRTYFLWQAKSIRDQLPNVRRAHYSPYLALVQFADKTAPGGVCLIALLDGPTAEPWQFGGWRIENGAAVEVDHLGEYYRFPMLYDQTPQSLKTAMIEGFKFSMEKQKKTASQDKAGK